tara:strand:- start:968 stop:1093 length:126 start_codon:yes stop_codon:yes gene_type:complete
MASNRVSQQNPNGRGTPTAAAPGDVDQNELNNIIDTLLEVR